jgi:hypothetical protein
MFNAPPCVPIVWSWTAISMYGVCMYQVDGTEAGQTMYMWVFRSFPLKKTTKCTACTQRIHASTVAFIYAL